MRNGSDPSKLHVCNASQEAAFVTFPTDLVFLLNFGMHFNDIDKKLFAVDIITSNGCHGVNSLIGVFFQQLRFFRNRSNIFHSWLLFRLLGLREVRRFSRRRPRACDDLFDAQAFIRDPMCNNCSFQIVFVCVPFLRVCEVCQTVYFELRFLVGRVWRLRRTNAFVDVSLSKSGFAAPTISYKRVHQFAGHDFNLTESTRLDMAWDVPF